MYEVPTDPRTRYYQDEVLRSSVDFCSTADLVQATSESRQILLSLFFQSALVKSSLRKESSKVPNIDSGSCLNDFWELSYISEMSDICNS